MKIVIYTQYRENYGSHSWDGEGECPQYWKNKGGDSIVVFTDEDFDLDTAVSIVEEIEPLIAYKNNSSEEFIMTYRVLGDSENTNIPDYEPIIVVQKIHEKWVCSKRYYGRSWYGSDKYLGKTETYTMLPEGNREDYKCVYKEK